MGFKTGPHRVLVTGTDLGTMSGPWKGFPTQVVIWSVLWALSGLTDQADKCASCGNEVIGRCHTVVGLWNKLFIFSSIFAKQY